MKKNVTMAVLGVCAIVALCETASARGLLGERYASAFFGLTKFGDSMMDSTGTGFGAGLNLPVDERLDLNFALSHQEIDRDVWWSDDIDATTFLGGANIVVKPGEKYCPFIIGRLGVIDVDSDKEGMFALGGAVEVDLTEETAVTPSLVFEHADDTNDIVLGVDGNYWFTKRFFALAGCAIGFDDGDFAFTLGAGFNF